MSRKRPKKSRGRKKSGGIGKALGLISLIILLVGLAAGAFLYKKYGPTKEKMDLNAYYELQGDQAAVVINQSILEDPGICENHVLYLDYKTVKKFINNRFYWDPNEKLLLYTLPDRTVSVAAGENTYKAGTTSEKADYTIVKAEGDTCYIAVDFLKLYTNLTFEVFENPNRVVISCKQSEVTAVEAEKDTEVRYRAGVKSKILTTVKKGEDAVVMPDQDVDGWVKVCTKDGLIGYGRERSFKSEQTKKIKSVYEDPEYTSVTRKKKINLAWHQVGSAQASESDFGKVTAAKGINVVSPTWFAIQDENGKLASNASKKYVDDAHKLGIEVWAIVDNFTYGKSAHKMLTNTTLRRKFVSNLIIAVKQCGADGINVDFERLDAADGDAFIQFVRELSVECRKYKLVLSVDNYVPGYTDYYNRKEQGIVADYVVIMGYDEHFAGSDEAGSVASINYVKEGIEDTIKDVPSKKVINGVPFYTRLWKEKSKSVSCEATIGMKAAANLVSQAGAKTTWDDATKQNYAQWSKDGATYKIWLEDNKSIKEKLKVMKNYDLGGVAAWKLGLETSDIWKLLNDYAK